MEKITFRTQQSIFLPILQTTCLLDPSQLFLPISLIRTQYASHFYVLKMFSTDSASLNRSRGNCLLGCAKHLLPFLIFINSMLQNLKIIKDERKSLQNVEVQLKRTLVFALTTLLVTKPPPISPSGNKAGLYLLSRAAYSDGVI